MTLKGNVSATRVRSNLVDIWFQSPDGDSSDVQVFELRCASHTQAIDIANRYNKMFGVEFTHTADTF